jgi:hypothetical protein
MPNFLIGEEYEDGAKPATLNPPVLSDTPLYAGERWCRSVRVEIFPKRGSAGRNSFEFHRFMDGKMVQRTIYEYKNFLVGCGLGKGKAKLDNVVVRRMVPAQGTERQ